MFGICDARGNPIKFQLEQLPVHSELLQQLIAKLEVLQVFHLVWIHYPDHTWAKLAMGIHSMLRQECHSHLWWILSFLKYTVNEKLSPSKTIRDVTEHAQSCWMGMGIYCTSSVVERYCSNSTADEISTPLTRKASLLQSDPSPVQENSILQHRRKLKSESWSAEKGKMR